MNRNVSRALAAVIAKLALGPEARERLLDDFGSLEPGELPEWILDLAKAKEDE